MTDFVCMGCQKKKSEEAWCEACLDESCNVSAEEAVEEYGKDHPGAAAVQGWVDREKAMGRLSPTELVEFERCIEDLR